MKKKMFSLLGVMALVLVLGVSAVAVTAQDEESAPVTLQDFAGEVATEDVYQAVASVADGVLVSTSDTGEWHTIGAALGADPVDISGYDQLCFTVTDPVGGNTVGVKLVDASGAATERWTDNEAVGGNPKTAENQWTTMCLNLIAYTEVDLTQITQIQFTMFAAGVYNFDDISVQMFGQGVQAAPPPQQLILTVVQDFEQEDTYYSDYQADVSLSTDVVYGGASSLLASSAEGEWHAFGAYPSERPLDVSGYDKVCFWIYDTTANNDGAAANTVGVSLIDAAGTKAEVWTDHADAGDNPKTVQNEWVQMCVNLSAYTGADMTQIDKIQFALYWAGDYYVDDIAFAIAIPDPAANLTQTVVQDFEQEDTYYSDYQADVSLSTDVVYGGASSLLASSAEGEWHAFGAYPSERPLDVSGYDKVCFWIYDTTANNDGAAANTVGVSLIDAAGTKAEVWTDHADAGANPKTVQNEWVQMCVNLSAYTGADMTQIDKIQFALYWAGDYYIDDISFGVLNEEAVVEVPEPVVENLEFTAVQDFEQEDTYYSDYQADVSLGDIAFSGASSLMATSAEGEWHAFGAYPSERPLDVSGYDKVCFWIYDTTTNNSGEAANTVGVSLIDAAGTKGEVWTDNPDAGVNPKTATNEWTQMCINLSAYADVDLTQIDKIQFSLYWAGTYYVDDISFAQVVP
ncbi:MAG: hypothetical protein H6672_15305 [Anaerolineaceae bacterium]|nr:hypothetical protein [Anaerolineaceae bacterium]